jgi:NhaP-type Na+/H+ or K+/H+ antiporter
MEIDSVLTLASSSASELVTPAIYLAGVLACGTLAQWAAWKLRIPAIILLLVTGFVVGRVAVPEDYIPTDLLFPIVSLAVAIILFEGGLSLRFRDVRETGGVVLRLVTVGIAITWIGTAVAAWGLLGFSLPMAVLCGALLTVSGPTVIIPLLRHVRPVRKMGALIKWEGIVNDPIGAVLAALIFEVVARGSDDGMLGHSLKSLGLTAAVGFVLGGLAAFVLIQLFRRYLVPDYLQNPIVLTVVLVVFAVSNRVQHESGLVTVTVLGVILANQRSVSLRHIIEFKENLRVLLIGTLFIILASRVPLGPSELAEFGWPLGELALRAAAFLAVVVVVIRPLAAFAATLFSPLNWRERLLLAWIHPRGIVAAAVSSLFALNLVRLAGAEGGNPALAAEGDRLVLATFWIIVGTVTIYGLTLSPLARRLGLASTNPQGVLFAGATPVVREIASAVKDEGFRVVLVDSNHTNIGAARMAGLPVLYASIVSEYAREELDLGDVGYLLAMTPNDQVNTLAVMEFTEHFGRAGVFQVAPPAVSSERKEPVSQERRGRILFGPEATYERLATRFAQGFRVKKTALTDDFTHEEFTDRYPDAIVLFVAEDKRLRVRSTDDEWTPKAGQKLIALVNVPEEVNGQ